MIHLPRDTTSPAASGGTGGASTTEKKSLAAKLGAGGQVRTRTSNSTMVIRIDTPTIKLIVSPWERGGGGRSEPSSVKGGEATQAAKVVAEEREGGAEEIKKQNSVDISVQVSYPIALLVGIHYPGTVHQ